MKRAASNVEIVRAVFEAYGAGDVEGVIDAADADIELRPEPGWRRPDRELGCGYARDVGRGPLGPRAHIRRPRGRRDFYRGVSTGRQSGVEVTCDFAAVCRIRDGLIASERVYLDREEALKATGLRE
jgi:ketosteroid isomerase-like protein